MTQEHDEDAAALALTEQHELLMDIASDLSVAVNAIAKSYENRGCTTLHVVRAITLLHTQIMRTHVSPENIPLARQGINKDMDMWLKRFELGIVRVEKADIGDVH